MFIGYRRTHSVSAILLQFSLPTCDTTVHNSRWILSRNRIISIEFCIHCLHISVCTSVCRVIFLCPCSGALYYSSRSPIVATPDRLPATFAVGQSQWLPAGGWVHSIYPSMCLLAENVHIMKIKNAKKMTVLNGIPNRRRRPSVKTSVLHNTKPKHWYGIYNSATNQTKNGAKME